ncbi:MAG: OmpA family protein [Spirochaetia bacterium]|nr:OmpA family protein [Spirochaetia bacterium]
MKTNSMKHAAVFLSRLILFSFSAASCVLSCGTGPAKVTARYESAPNQFVLLATTAGDSCEEIGRKRIVKLAYLWPLNPLTHEDLKKSERTARKYRTEINAGDVGWSLLGFLFGVVTETTVAEACTSPIVTISAAELARLKEAEQKATRDVVQAETKPVAYEGATPSVSRSNFPELTLESNQPRQAYTLYFAFASADLSKSEEQRLAAIAEDLKRLISGHKILIVGHADRLGQKEWNDSLSNQRARTIQEKLAQAGLDRKILIPVSASSNWPAGSSMASAPTIERRVEIILVRGEK